jgi:uncharacterized protein YbdZ (MbtH family)
MQQGEGFAMKPLGLTATFQIVRPDRVQDAIWEAVEKAIDAGWQVENFRQEAAECWSEYLRQKKESDAKEWRK